MKEGLALALRMGSLPPALRAVSAFAELTKAEGDIPRALEISGLAMCHSAWSSDHQQGAANAITSWNLDPELVSQGLAGGGPLIGRQAQRNCWEAEAGKNTVSSQNE